MSLFQFDSNDDKVSSVASKEQIEQRIVDDKPSMGYSPGTPLHFFFGFDNQLPPIWKFYRELEVMLIHPRVKIALDYFKSGLASGEISVTAKRPDVAAYVEEQFRRLWQASLSKIQEGYDYGWIGAEVVYRQDDDGRLAFDHLKTFHPRDVRVLTQDHDYYGIRVTNVASKAGNTVDLWGPKRGLAKGFWYAHRGKHGSLWGLSQVLASWRPWRRLACRDGGEDIIDLAIFKFGTQPVVVKFPPGAPNVDPAHGVPGNPSNQEKAISTGETVKSGSVVAISSACYDGTNIPKWEVNTQDRNASFQAGSLIEYNEHLEKQISMGIGVPPELLEASETGSGYSGRQIPLEAFYEGQQAIGREIIRAFREQVVEPLAKWNWGEDAAEFDIELLPLLQTRSTRIGPDMVQPGAEPGMPASAGAKPQHMKGPDGKFIPAAPSQIDFMSTLFEEVKHPRDDIGRWEPASMTSGQFEKHLRETGQRHEYGPGLGAVKLAHRTHVHDALKSGVDIPDVVRSEYPELAKRYPVPKARPAYMGRANATEKLAAKRHAREVAQSQAANRAKWAAEIHEEFGVHPKHVHETVQQIKDLHKSMMQEHNLMIADAFSAFAKMGVSRKQVMEGEDELPGSDVVGQMMANRYPGLLGTGTAGSGQHAGFGEYHDPSAVDPFAKLLPFMQAGPVGPMSDEEAYAKVRDQIAGYHDAGVDVASPEEEDDSLGAGEGRGRMGAAFDFGALSKKQPHEMTRREFGIDRMAKQKALAVAHYRQGFVGMPTPDKENSRPARVALAKQANLEGETHNQAVTTWPLHKLHVAAAMGRGEEVPAHASMEYPDLHKHTMLSADIGLEDDDAESAVTVILAALKPLRRTLVKSLVRTLLYDSPASWWHSISQLIGEFKDQTAQALAIARVAVALAAMRRVVSLTPAMTPNLPVVIDQLSAAPLLQNVGGYKPIVSLTIIEDAANDLLNRKLLTRSDYDALTEKARDEAFTVAGMQSDASMETVRDLINQAVTEGKDRREWMQAVRQTLDGTDPFLSARHAETVFRTNVQAAYSHGLDTVLANPMVGDHFPYIRYVAIRDARVRPWHLALESSGIDGGDVYWVDDPIWDTIKPPSDYSCRCGRIPMTVEQAARHGLAEAEKWLTTGIEPQHGLGHLPANWQQSESFARV